MRSDREINNEIVALKNAMTLRGVHHGSRWSESARNQIRAQIRVLEDRMTDEQITRDYYCDESDPDYTDDDNEVYNVAQLTLSWMNGETGYDAPSAGL